MTKPSSFEGKCKTLKDGKDEKPPTKTLHSIVPAMWSSLHRHWTCQKPSNSSLVVRKAGGRVFDAWRGVCVSIGVSTLEELVQEVVQTAVCKIIQKADPKIPFLSSVGPALWSPLHRKWCGHDALKAKLLPIQPKKASSSLAIEKLVFAKDLGILPTLASSMLNVALSIEAKPMKLEDLPAQEAQQVQHSERPGH